MQPAVEQWAYWVAVGIGKYYISIVLSIGWMATMVTHHDLFFQ